MNNPITNDPITMVAEAFAQLYPGAKYEAAYAPDIRDNEGTVVCSCIVFPSEDDGADALPLVLINSQAGIEVVAEAFARELAHVALGPDSLGGGAEYDASVDSIAAKYKEIAEKRFPDAVWAQHEGGADDE